MLRAALLTLTLAALTTGCGKTTNNNQATQTRPATPTTSTPAPTGQTPTTPIHTSTGKPLTQAQWIARGDAICAKLIRQLNPLKVKSVNEIPRLLPQELIYMRAEITALSKLTPPTNKTNDWQQLLNLKQAWIDGTAQLATNPEFIHTLNTNPLAKTLRATRLRASKLAQHDGFNKCSRT